MRFFFPFLLSSVPTGCSPSWTYEERRFDTAGDLGKLRFEYSDLERCTSGCTMEQEVLADAEIDVAVRAIDPSIDYRARSTDPAIADMRSTSHCNEQQSDCFEGVTIVTKKAGEVKLEMFNGWTGKVIDTVTVKVRNAAKIETIIKVGEKDISSAAANGLIEVKLDSDVDISSTATSASGARLLFTRGGFDFDYKSKNVLGPRRGFNFFESTNTENAKANTLGDATVTVKAGTVQRDLTFRVVR